VVGRAVTSNHGTTLAGNDQLRRELHDQHANAADINEVVLLRAGAAMHGLNMSQRGIELVIVGIGAGTLGVETCRRRTLHCQAGI
jgi:hypothetical protein